MTGEICEMCGEDLARYEYEAPGQPVILLCEGCYQGFLREYPDDPDEGEKA